MYHSTNWASNWHEQSILVLWVYAVKIQNTTKKILSGRQVMPLKVAHDLEPTLKQASVSVYDSQRHFIPPEYVTVNSPQATLKDWHTAASSVTHKAWQSLSGFLQDQVQIDRGSSRWTALILRLPAAWIFNLGTRCCYCSESRSQRGEAGWGGWTRWKLTHVALLRLPRISSNIKML